MFKTLLVANRGEIACRVMRTARRMGIRTVAVYSEADAGAPHVRDADEAVLLGPAPASESYLRADRIIEAARQTGADAIHPGYGFLSENADFAEACARNGIVFVGPSPEAIRAMGLKDRAKALMEQAGVPVTPGYHGDNQDPALLADAAGTIGFPVLIKAVAGGGGKGMRKVEAAADFAAALESCKREASKSFGDDRVLIEKFITDPRHIEVQVFGDSRGRVVHMFERDCSLQRRHQKVIEEAPAPGMTPAVRAAMCSAAINAARAVNYVGAGTVEFIVDGSGPLREDGFFFMEMNTRLQVEHPVTEMVTGLDLVELQLRVAAGGSVPEQDDIHLSGHAIEGRLYAEDPASGFLPSTGILERFRLPPDSGPDAARVDTGFDEGQTVSLHYDPMLAKIVVHENTRDAAIDALLGALRHVDARPVKTNAGFLYRAADHADFRAARLTTGFIDAHLDALAKREAGLDHWLLAALAVNGGRPFTRNRQADRSIWSSGDGWRLNAPARVTVQLALGEDTRTVIFHRDGLRLAGRVDDHAAEVTLEALDEPIDIGWQPDMSGPDTACEAGWFMPAGYPDTGLPYEVERDGVRLFDRADVFHFVFPHPEALADAAEAGGVIKAPMPGKVLAVNVKPGDNVTKGQALVVLEAMKMEHALGAPRDGVIADVSVETGGQVGEGDVLVTLAEAAENAA